MYIDDAPRFAGEFGDTRRGVDFVAQGGQPWLRLPSRFTSSTPANRGADNKGRQQLGSCAVLDRLGQRHDAVVLVLPVPVGADVHGTEFHRFSFGSRSTR